MQDRIISTYNALESLNATAKACGVSVKTVYKVLCSAGVYPSEQAERVNRLAETMSVDEIANRLNITPKTVRSYLPYTRGTYLTEDKTINAQRIAACRERKKAQK